MKRILIRSAATLIVALICSVGAYAQQVRVALKGDANLIKEGKYVALEVAGKIVLGFDEEFTEIITSSGKYFAATDEDGGWYIYDRNGKETEIGGGSYGSKFDKARMVDGTIIVEKNGKTHYFNESDLTKEAVVEQAAHDFFDKGRDFNPEKMTRDKASTEAERLSALMPPENRFEIRQKSNSQRQEVVVHGKVVHEAQEYTVLSDEEWFKEKEFWVLVAKNNGKYGVVAINAYADKETGKREGYAVQMVPYEYSFARFHDGTGPMITCTTMSGARTHFNYYGWNFDHDYRTGKYTGTKKRWVYDEATEKWMLRAAADGEQLRYTKWTPDKATGKLTLTNKW
ncbi:hypothetical protein KML24007_04420 [Alistipes indistinctus]|uniref:hypothetical protein n=1 Tax=Alistipes indistinctus TaxID=626932 RepID=UPI0036F34D75